ncbi:MAG: YjbE family putative metal transport protein [Alphaproteobacteria bacterium]|nr:YjbE family putative metal transport protein [Alphaproteobacteria bacterium]MDE1930229.1 YjbE family putative metal transport protein [Alphaproteobacteria bacterium]
MDWAIADWGALGALVSVVLIDVVLAGDNAIVVGMATALVPREMRRKVLFAGIGAAAVLRILLALAAVDLLTIIGLTLAGGILLLWVAWKLYRELAARAPHGAAASTSDRRHRVGGAVMRIVIADLSMSLDNVLAVAGTARNHPWILAGGLLLSVALMAVASQLLAKLLDRHRWIAWLGLAIVAYVALRMIVEGLLQVAAVS